MESLKPYIFILIFLGVALFNYLRSRLPNEKTAGRDVEGSDGERSAVVERHSIAQPEPPAPRSPRSLPLAPPRASRSPRGLIAGRRNLRRAVIAMTVLGPCRAQQPHDFDR